METICYTVVTPIERKTDPGPIAFGPMRFTGNGQAHAPQVLQSVRSVDAARMMLG